MDRVYLIKKHTRGRGWSKDEIVCVTFVRAMASEILKQLKEKTHLKPGEFGFDYVLEDVPFVSGVNEIPEAIMKWT